MNSLKTYFSRIVVISLPDRADRREKLLRNLSECELAEEGDITWFDAVDGRKETIPDWWETGPGAWGCRFSQLRVIEQAQHDDLENVLIIEDDAVFHPRTIEWLDLTMPILPGDWGQFFLGGQHMAAPRTTDHPKLLKGRCITRTHAYAVHRRAYDIITRLVRDDEEYKKRPGWHVDHQFGHSHANGKWNAYAPSWWMAGQEEGVSDITPDDLGRRWWQPGRHYWKLPILNIPEQSPLARDPRVFFPSSEAPQNPNELTLWLRRIASEAWNQGRLPACDVRAVGGDVLQRIWPGGVSHPQTLQDIRSLADYPANGLFPHPFFTPTNP